MTDAPDKRALTEELFEQIRQGQHEAVFSTLYLEEVAKAPSPLLRYQLEGVPTVYGLNILNFNKECQAIAKAYIDAKAFTERNLLDASHVATAAHYGFDAVVSWNFQHIVRAWTMKLVSEVHQRLGLSPIIICSPAEVLGHD